MTKCDYCRTAEAVYEQFRPFKFCTYSCAAKYLYAELQEAEQKLGVLEALTEP